MLRAIDGTEIAALALFRLFPGALRLLDTPENLCKIALKQAFQKTIPKPLVIM